MFRIIGPKGKDLCDAHLRPSRRDILRVGGTGMLGHALWRACRMGRSAWEKR